MLVDEQEWESSVDLALGSGSVVNCNNDFHVHFANLLNLAFRLSKEDLIDNCDALVAMRSSRHFAV